jgi:hypothetical protein
MFKVICVQGTPKDGKPLTEWKIKEGEIYIVIGLWETKWGMVYELDIQPDVGYWPEYFVPLSEIDEIQMERNYQTEKVCMK